MSDSFAKKHDKTVEYFMSAITADNSLNSWFLRLPGELRNRIYHFALSDGILDIRHNRKDFALNYEPIAPSGIGLLCVCCQVRHETVALLLRFITHRFASLSSLQQYVRSIPITTRNALSSLVAGTYLSLRGLGLIWSDISSLERTASSLSELCPGVHSVVVEVVLGPDHQRGAEPTRLAEIQPLKDWLRGGSREKPHVEVKLLYLPGV